MPTNEDMQTLVTLVTFGSKRGRIKIMDMDAESKMKPSCGEDI